MQFLRIGRFFVQLLTKQSFLNPLCTLPTWPVRLEASRGNVALVVALVREKWEAAFVFAMAIWFCVLACFYGVGWLRKEFGQPRIVDWAARRQALRHLDA